MANPFHKAAHASGKAKMGRIHKHHYAKGGHVKHSDAAEDRKLISKMITQHEDHKVHGRKAGGRLDRKHHRKSKAPAAAGMPPTGMAPPDPTAMPPPGMSAGPTPDPTQMGGPMGMQKRGGRVKHRKHGGRISDKGESTAKNLASWAGYAKENSYGHKARGGRIGKYPLKKGGSDSGVGRLELSKAEKRSYP